MVVLSNFLEGAVEKGGEQRTGGVEKAKNKQVFVARGGGYKT